MIRVTLRTMNNIVNDYTNHPLRNTTAIKHDLALKYNLPYEMVDNVIYEHEYGYIDADDVDLGERVGIVNPEWEHKPEAFLVFKAIHQLFAHDNSFCFERSGGYKSW